MRTFGLKMSAFLCGVLVVLISSCSHFPKTAGPTGAETKIMDDTARQAQEQIALGAYKKALAICAGAYDKYHYPQLRRTYRATGEQVRNAADAAFQGKNFAEAGSIYRILFESGIVTRDFAESLSFNDDYLNGQIKTCSKALTEVGLIKYREEKLDEAISIWEKVLAFDPDNKAVIKAVDTATRQLQKLKNIK